MSPSKSDQGAWLAMLGAMLLMSVHVGGKAVRDTLFLSHFGAAELPKMMIAGAAAALVAAIGTSRFLSRAAPARVVPPAMALSGGLLLGEWALVTRAPGPGAIAIYLHLAAISLVLFSGFWSTVGERFDPYTAKRVVARTSAFGCLGGILGGLAAMQVAPIVGSTALLPFFAGLHLIVAGLVLALTKQTASSQVEEDADSGISGLRALLSFPFVLRMALLMAVIQATEPLVDFVFKATAAGVYVEEASLVRFFAIFYTATAVLAFSLQIALGPGALQRLGVGVNLALLPGAVALTSSVAAVFQRVVTVSVARAANNVMSSSFFKAGFEQLWTPVPNETRRPAKVYVDVGASGLGELAGSGLVFLLVTTFVALPHSVLLGLAAVLSMASLFLVSHLHRGYVRQLANSLRSATATGAGRGPDEKTVRPSLAESQFVIDRAELMARIRELDAAAPAPTRSAAPATADEGESAVTAEALVACVSDLVSGDPERVRHALQGASGRVELASFAIPLLARHVSSDDATAFLRELAPRIVGQLSDALTDPATEVLIQRRLPRALEGAPGRRAMDALMAGLDLDDFETRLACARAAARMADESPDLSVESGQVLTWVEREIAASDRLWEHQGRRRQTVEDPALLEPADLPRVDRSMELVFTLLSLAWGRQVMGSSLRALYSGDPALRGTALEYLKTILPDALQRALAARIPGGDTARPTRRRAEELAEALTHSSAALPRRRGGR